MSLPSAPIPLVALVSGGKDSIYNISQCLSSQTHFTIDCVAHLHPENQSIQELDSFMFQSVGHNIVTSSYADALQIPLITHTTNGQSKFRDLSYTNSDESEADEVEDLYHLLQKVLHRFPHIRGVTCGAIFSDYQRLRVENVCQRLGLVSVAMLWRRPQDVLLREMIDSGINAILVKVATIGLRPQRHCGKSIEELYDYLMQLRDEYQINCCGEGGEYESLVLDCALFSKSIVVDESRVIVDSNDDFAPSGHLIVDKLHLEEKETSPYLNLEGIKGPRLEHPRYQEERRQWRKAHGGNDAQLPSAAPAIFIPAPSDDVIALPREVEDTLKAQLRTQCVVQGDYLHFSGHFFRGETETTTSDTISQKQDAPTLEQEVCHLMSQLRDECELRHNFSLDTALHVVLRVRDMSMFGRINQVYCRFFQHSPPSRVCIEDAKGLRLAGNVALDCVFGLDPELRKKVLHVQSISPWAPACIGPYSQATVLDDVIRLAGQIAFIPETMQLCKRSPVTEKDWWRDEANLCLSNLQNVLDALRSNLSNTIRCLIYVDEACFGGDYETLKEVREHFMQACLTKRTTEFSCTALHSLKSWNLSPHVAVVPVTHLPRSAAVEYHLFALTDQVQEVNHSMRSASMETNTSVLTVQERLVFGAVETNQRDNFDLNSIELEKPFARVDIFSPLCDREDQGIGGIIHFHEGAEPEGRTRVLFESILQE